jgi:hypothetical protein
MGVVGIPGSVRQYVSGLGAATLGLCAAGWLALAPVAFGYRSARTGAALPGSALPGSALHRAVVADWATGAALGVVSLATLVAWVVAWRRKLRADGIVAPSSRRLAWREARSRRRQDRDGVRAADVAEPAAGAPDPARVLSELRALLIPLLDEAEAVHEEPVHEEPLHEARSQEPARDAGARDESASPASAVPPPRPGGLAAMESMLAGAELLMVACGEEEAW